MKSKYLCLLFMAWLVPLRADPALLPGTTQNSLTADGQTRTYLLHRGTAATGSAPLVIALHGRNMTAHDMERVTRLDILADHAGFTAVYPQALGDPTAWAHFATPTPPGGDDLRFLDTLLDTLIKQGTADKRRVYVVGLSNGGMMAYRFAAHAGKRIAAAAIVSGWLEMRSKSGQSVTIDPAASPVPMLIFHGRQDPNIPYEGGGPGEWAPGSVANAVQWWVKADKCHAVPQRDVSHGGNVIRETYSGGKDGSEVVLYTLVDGSHAWPGAPLGLGPYPPCPDVDATALLWDFFQRHPRP